MIRNISKLACLSLLLLLASCIKEGYDRDNCPGEYTITPLTPDELSEGAVEMTGAKVTLVNSATGEKQDVTVGSDTPIDLEDGTYTVVAVKGTENENVTVDGKTVSVTTKPDGTANDIPEDLAGGYTDITVSDSPTDQGNINFNVPTHVQSRPLTVKLTFEGENTALIESIGGMVDGIALSRDLNNGFVPTDGQPRHPATTAGSINYSFTKDAEGNLYTDSHRLLGIDGDDTQTLTLTVNYAGGVQKTYTFDVTQKMDGFHTTDVLNPWVIEITLRLGADFTATIEDWASGPESWMDAH